MKTFIFIQRNGSATITLSADNYSEALDTMYDIVVIPDDWRVEDVNGEDEELL